MKPTRIIAPEFGDPGSGQTGLLSTRNSSNGSGPTGAARRSPPAPALSLHTHYLPNKRYSMQLGEKPGNSRNDYLRPCWQVSSSPLQPHALTTDPTTSPMRFAMQPLCRAGSNHLSDFVLSTFSRPDRPLSLDLGLASFGSSSVRVRSRSFFDRLLTSCSLFFPETVASHCTHSSKAVSVWHAIPPRSQLCFGDCIPRGRLLADCRFCFCALLFVAVLLCCACLRFVGVLFWLSVCGVCVLSRCWAIFPLSLASARS